MKSQGYKPGAVAFTALLSSASKLDINVSQSAGVACLLRQMLTANEEINAVVPADKQDGMSPQLQDRSPIDESVKLLNRHLHARPPSAGPYNHGHFSRSLQIVTALIAARVQPPSSLWESLFREAHTTAHLDAAWYSWTNSQATTQGTRRPLQHERVRQAIAAARNRAFIALTSASMPSADTPCQGGEFSSDPSATHQPFSKARAPLTPELRRTFQVLSTLVSCWSRMWHSLSVVSLHFAL